MSIMRNNQDVSHYSQVGSYTGVIDGDSHKLVLMLLEGALEKVAVTKGLMTHGEVGKKGQIIGQAISIIGGLRSSLNMSAGGDIATNLDSLYEYIERQLLTANLKDDVELLEEVADLLREIKSGWEAIPLELRIKPDLEVSLNT